ncbi:MAG: hypothetical protein J6Q95_07160 [Alistipes sp.]|nr:hypothetical protein [Alistipes sp.]
MFRSISLVIAAMLLLITGVEAKGGDVVVEGVTRVTHLSSSGANLWLRVHNDRASRVVLKRAVVEVAVDGVPQVELSLREKVVVRGRRTEDVLVPLRFESRRTLSFLRLLRKALDGSGEGITISYELRGGTLLFRRTIAQKDITLRDVATLLGMDFQSFKRELDKIRE